MRKLTLALLPACLLLAGAAPPQSALDALVECRMPRPQAYAALAGMQELTGVAPRVRDGERAMPLVIPETLRMFGAPILLLVKTTDVAAPQDTFGFLTVVKGPFDAMEKRVLAGHGLSKCEERVEDRELNCVIFSRTAEGRRTLFLMQEFDDGNVGISCNHYPVKE